MAMLGGGGIGAAAVTQEPRTYYDPDSLNANTAGMVTEKWDEATREWYPVNPYLGRMQGAALPPGYAFSCPDGSDYDKSQEVGMCVAADYSPVGIKSPAGGATTYYNLDGTVGGVDPGKPKSKDWIPGVPNMAVLGALGLLLVLRMRR